MGAPVAPVNQARREETLARLEADLGDAGLAAAWTEGAALSLAEVTAVVLGETAAAVPETSPQPEWRAFALGKSQVQVGQRLLSDADWTYSKARELFFYLLIHAAAGKAQIGLALWPEASPAQLRSAFHRTLYYLRQALGRVEWVLFTDGRYHLNRTLAHWFDVLAFDDHLAAAGRALKAGAAPANRAQAIQRFTAALDLYGGDFLADLDGGEWAIFQREELRRRCLEAHLSLAALYFSDAHYAEAAAVYRRLIALDSYLETAHRELMRCLARQGETSQAVRHYHALRQFLHDELDVSPATETTALFERLRRDDRV
jgi:DNA-binding SARP family transcriptional activator